MNTIKDGLDTTKKPKRGEATERLRQLHVRELKAKEAAKKRTSVGEDGNA